MSCHVMSCQHTPWDEFCEPTFLCKTRGAHANENGAFGKTSARHVYTRERYDRGITSNIFFLGAETVPARRGLPNPYNPFVEPHDASLY